MSDATWSLKLSELISNVYQIDFLQDFKVINGFKPVLLRHTIVIIVSLRAELLVSKKSPHCSFTCQLCGLGNLPQLFYLHLLFFKEVLVF